MASQRARVFRWWPQWKKTAAWLTCIELTMGTKYILELDLMNHAHAAHVLRQHGPFDMVQLSPPCIEFSVSGRCIEGRVAWLTVTAALLILDIGVPVLCIENVEQMAKAAAWDIARERLVDAGYVLEQVVVDAADCGVAQNRRRLFVAGARTGRTADQ